MSVYICDNQPLHSMMSCSSIKQMKKIVAFRRLVSYSSLKAEHPSDIHLALVTQAQIHTDTF